MHCISLNARNYLNYAFSYAFNFEIISHNKNLKYAILSYGDEVKSKLTGGANQTTDNKGKKFILSHSENVIRLKYKFNTSDKSKYVSYDKYAIFEHSKVIICCKWVRKL